MTTASLSSSSQDVFHRGGAVHPRTPWIAAEAPVLPRKVLQDSTRTPSSIMLDDMLEKPTDLSYGRPSAPGIPSNALEVSHSNWASQKSTDEPELERVRRRPGTWANGSYLEETNSHQRGDSGRSVSMPGADAASTQAKPRVTVPKLWREGALGPLCVMHALPDQFLSSHTFFCTGNTPRTPGNSVSTCAAYKVPAGGEDSEFSSSDDDTSYGGKKV